VAAANQVGPRHVKRMLDCDLVGVPHVVVIEEGDQLSATAAPAMDASHARAQIAPQLYQRQSEGKRPYTRRDEFAQISSPR
jgi:hypothetical protein